ncbi:hypothetical protein ACFPM3_26125 [Streptomyces coeruleoprunus]|uniref:Uncharacterized protein n=1 Tax=Streptomyces coeruleoprunus TaxID=285563 RepID=A0ABV9XLK2_9ACTN
MTPQPEERSLHDAFAEAAHDITPGPVPLAAVERAGRTRRRRRSTALALGSALLVTAVAVTAVRAFTPRQGVSLAVPAVTAHTARPTGPTPAPPAKPPTVVQPGQRLTPAPGVQLWLTPEGKHWSTPDGGENFRSVTDGNLKTAEPGLSHQSEGAAGGVFHSGVYYGTRKAARIVFTTRTSSTTATLVELPGNPGWGAWYISTPPSTQDAAITLYDATGKVLAALPGGPP